MKVSLVAGVAGFLGSHLARKLLEAGHYVIGIDNFATSSNKNLEDLLKDKNFRFVQASVSENLQELDLRDLNFIFHLASPASPPKYQKLGIETLRANTVGTENLIGLAISNSARFIFASTSEVYGDPQVSPQPEEYWGNVNPIGPRSIYDESKRLGETLVAHYVREQSLNGGIVRIFNTYGPGMDPFDGRVVSTFIRQALAAEPFSIFGDGKQTRSFCYVDDLITGIILMAESQQSGPINLGNPAEIDLMRLSQEVASVVGTEPKFEFHDLPEDDPKQRKPDISKAASLLGWQPTTTLAEGLSKTSVWMAELDLSGSN
jgi:nucleoside-diphosphate-sugar epimerase